MARPKEFDPDQALERAMEVFWSRGYRKTSISDLVRRLGINRGSLYATFGSKRELFLAALDLYQDRAIAAIERTLREQRSARAGIRKLFHWFLEDRAFTTSHRGCLMTNTVLELLPGDEAVIRVLGRGYQRLEDAFYAALLRARDQGELSSNGDPRRLAGFLVSSIQGLRVIERTYRTREKVKQVRDVVLSMLN